MMKTYLKRAFQLSDSGVKGLAKSIWSFFLYYVSFVPPMICVFLFADRLLNGNTGKPVVYLLFMLVATLVMYLVINYNYKTTYDETYQESATLRIDLAEQLSKLPLALVRDVTPVGEHPVLLIHALHAVLLIVIKSVEIFVIVEMTGLLDHVLAVFLRRMRTGGKVK